MKTDLWLLLVGLVLYISPLSYLEYLERRKKMSIKLGRDLSRTYTIADIIFIFLFLIALTIQIRRDNLPTAVFVAFLSLDLIKMGLYSSFTGKFPYRTRSGTDYFYVDKSRFFISRDMNQHFQSLDIKLFGRITTLSSIVYMIVSLFLIYQ